MSARRLGCVAALALALALPHAAGAAAPRSETPRAGAGLVSTRALVAKLKASGRGEASITVTLTDPLGGADHVQAGRLALEPRDRVRLDFAATGERVAVRGDAGEWIQPQARQMVRLGPDQAGMAAWLWEILMQGGTGGFSERAAGPRRHVLTPRDPEAGLPESIVVALDAAGLPTRIEFTESPGVTTRYRFKGWRFMRPRGAPGFTLSAPRGYSVVELP